MQAASRVAPAASASSSRRTFRSRANVVVRPMALSTYSGMRRASIVDSIGSSRGRVSLTAAISRSGKVAPGTATRRFTTTAMFEVRAIVWLLSSFAGCLQAETLPSCWKRVSECWSDAPLPSTLSALPRRPSRWSCSLRRRPVASATTSWELSRCEMLLGFVKIYAIVPLHTKPQYVNRVVRGTLVLPSHLVCFLMTWSRPPFRLCSV